MPPLDPPGPAFQLLVCIVFVFVWFKTTVMAGEKMTSGSL